MDAFATRFMRAPAAPRTLRSVIDRHAVPPHGRGAARSVSWSPRARNTAFRNLCDRDTDQFAGCGTMLSDRKTHRSPKTDEYDTSTTARSRGGNPFSFI